MNRIDEIVQAGFDKLDWFYEDTSKLKKRCEEPGCYKKVGAGVKFCERHRKRNAIPFLIGKHDPASPKAVPPPERKAVLTDLSSKQIIEEVLKLTGTKITVCVKSKKNVIKHATEILKGKNYKVVV